MAKPVLSIIIVSYNTRALTLECLRSVFAETRTPFELIVVDNASTDGSAAAIAVEFPDIRLLAETTNHGFAKANNIAAALAQGEYLLLLNPDTVVLDGALDKLVAFSRRQPKARIWGGRTLFDDKSLNPASCWRRMTLWGLFCSASGLSKVFAASAVFNSEAYGGWDRASERQVDIVTGCLFLLRRADWNILGGFDLTFFMYGEEADLCLRAHSIGARPRVTPEAMIIHYGGASEKVAADKTVRVLTAKRALVKRHFPAWQEPLAALLLAGWPLSRHLALKAATLISRRRDLRESQAAWAEVWRRRSEWMNGFG